MVNHHRASLKTFFQVQVHWLLLMLTFHWCLKDTRILKGCCVLDGVPARQLAGFFWFFWGDDMIAVLWATHEEAPPRMLPRCHLPLHHVHQFLFHSSWWRWQFHLLWWCHHILPGWMPCGWGERKEEEWKNTKKYQRRISCIQGPQHESGSVTVDAVLALVLAVGVRGVGRHWPCDSQEILLQELGVVGATVNTCQH